MAEDTAKTPAGAATLIRGQQITGKVTDIKLYGAFVDIGTGQKALLHISQLGKSDVRSVEDVVKVGDEVQAYVLKVDPRAGHVALTMEKPAELSWDEIKTGDVYSGTVIRIEDFGVFVDIGADRPGMVHVSELANGFVKSPSDVVRMDETVEVRILKVNRKKRQIDLTMKMSSQELEEVMSEPDEETPTAMEAAFRRAMAGQDETTEAERARRAKAAKNRAEQDEIIARTLRQRPN